MNSGRNNAIDSLKGIAILGIILVHCGQFFPECFITPIISAGARGVQLMYLINGYLTAISLNNYFSKNNKVFGWYKKKLIRIIPMYWIFTVISVLVTPEGNTYWLGGLDKLSPVNIIMNLLCLQGFYPYYINAININWFMADIIIWYFIAPIIWKKLRDLNNCIVILIIYIPVIAIFFVFISRLQLDVVLNTYFTYFWFLAQFPCILLGVILSHLNNISTHIDNRIAYSGLVAFSVIFIGLTYSYFSIDVFNITITYGILFFMLVWLELKKPCKIFCNRLLAVLGKYSFGIYLSHYTIIILVSRMIENKGMELPNIYFSLMIFFLICMLSFGIGSIVEIIQNKIIEHKFLIRS